MINIFKIIHLFSLFSLVAVTGIAFASAFAPALKEHRKKILMWAGIASLLVFLTGFGLLGMQKYGFPAWSIVKVLCWLTVSALAGVVLRRPEKAKFLSCLGGVALVLAMVMVFFQPGL